MDTDALSCLSIYELETLKNAYKHGSLKHYVSASSILSLVENIDPLAVQKLVELNDSGWSNEQCAFLLESILRAKLTAKEELLDLVLSGPKHSAIPTRDTFAVYSDLINSAKKSVTLVSYAVYNGKELFELLAKKMTDNEDFTVKMYLDIPRKANDTTVSELIIQKYKVDFFQNQWPSKTKPELFFFKKSLESNWKERASMHAKIIIVDQQRSFITSANLTKAAQEKNIEAGVLINDQDLSKMLTNYFKGQIEQEVFTSF